MFRKSFIKDMMLWRSLKIREFPKQPRYWGDGDSRQKIQRSQGLVKFYEEFRSCLMEWRRVYGKTWRERLEGTKATSPQVSLQATLTSVCFLRAVKSFRFSGKRVPVSKLFVSHHSGYSRDCRRRPKVGRQIRK